MLEEVLRPLHQFPAALAAAAAVHVGIAESAARRPPRLERDGQPQRDHPGPAAGLGREREPELQSVAELHGHVQLPVEEDPLMETVSLMLLFIWAVVVLGSVLSSLITHKKPQKQFPREMNSHYLP